MKALVLSSGGLDSTVCLALAAEKYGADEVIALSVYYGQKHIREIEAAALVAEYYHVKRMSVDLSEVFKGCSSSLIEGSGSGIPHGSYADQLEETDGSPVDTYVPYRNGLFLSAAASVALTYGCSEIYYGAHADDSAGNAYPDTSKEFNKAISDSIYIGSGNALHLIAPFIDSPKAEVVKEGIRLGVPFELTWSCYEGADKACEIGRAHV